MSFISDLQPVLKNLEGAGAASPSQKRKAAEEKVFSSLGVA